MSEHGPVISTEEPSHDTINNRAKNTQKINEFDITRELVSDLPLELASDRGSKWPCSAVPYGKALKIVRP
jgi:hypothetical protein